MTTEGNTLDREQRKLLCKLTDDELRARGDTMAEAELSIDERKEVRRGINGEIATLRTKRNELATVIEARAESRMVDCAWIEDPSKPFEHLVRQDTGEQIETRPLDEQESLPFGKVLDGDTGEVLDAPAEAAPAAPDIEPRITASFLASAADVAAIERLAADDEFNTELDAFDDVIDDLTSDDDDDDDGDGPFHSEMVVTPPEHGGVIQGPPKKRNGNGNGHAKQQRPAAKRRQQPPSKGKNKPKTSRTLHA
jgi:hypothetical protein